MRHKMYWGLGALIILIIGTAGVLFMRHNRAEMARFEKALADADNRLQESDSSPQQPAQRGVGSPTYKPPPLGETEDTGHWDGNVWHQTTPKPKKKKVFGLWSREMTLRDYRAAMPHGNHDNRQTKFMETPCPRSTTPPCPLDAAE